MAEKLTTFQTAAERWQCSVPAVRKWASEGRFRIIRLGRACRLREEDVERVAREGLGKRRDSVND